MLSKLLIILLVPTLVLGAGTTITNIQINAPFTSNPSSLSGSLSDASVSYDMTVPASTQIQLYAEVSSDGGTTWRGLYAVGIDNPTSPKTTSYIGGFGLPNVKGNLFRIRVPIITGTVTLNSVSVTN